MVYRLRILRFALQFLVIILCNKYQVKYGKNKKGNHLPQINLDILFGEESSLPFYYRKLAGNIPDIKTIRELIHELDILGYSKTKLVMDCGFCSTDNVNALYKNHYKFLLGASTTLKYTLHKHFSISDIVH